MADGRTTGDHAALSRMLDVATAGTTPAARLDRLLRLVARTAGATCAVALLDDAGRRTIGWRRADGPAARGTAAWLDGQTRGRRELRVCCLMLDEGDVECTEPVRTVDAPRPGIDGDDGTERDDAAGGDAAGGAGGAGVVDAVRGDRAWVRADGTAGRGDDEEIARAANDGRMRTIATGRGGRRAAVGLHFRTARAAGELERRLPVSLARSAAGMAASLLREIAAQRELTALRHADEERRTFVSVVAHELRTPLASLSGYLDLLAADADGEFLSRSRDLAAGMATLVADLLEISRLGAGQLHLALARFSAAEAAQAAVRDVTPLALQRGIVLEATLGTRLRTVYGDRRRVQQVLVNLLANAVKFSHVGGRVAISLRFDGPVALYAIADEGPGVAPEERERIFEPFHRAAGSEPVVGTGLGLPIARDLARRMGGDVAVSPAPGHGSVFVVALPSTEATDRATVMAALERALGREDLAPAP